MWDLNLKLFREKIVAAVILASPPEEVSGESPPAWFAFSSHGRQFCHSSHFLTTWKTSFPRLLLLVEWNIFPVFLGSTSWQDHSCLWSTAQVFRRITSRSVWEPAAGSISILDRVLHPPSGFTRWLDDSIKKARSNGLGPCLPLDPPVPGSVLLIN